MKTLLLLIVLYCQVGAAPAQNRALVLSKSQLADSAKGLRDSEQLIELNAIAKSPYKFHVRVSDGGFIVEVWQKDTVFQGKMTRWVADADEASKYPERNQKTIYYQQYLLGEAQATSIAQLLMSSGVLQLPSDEDIKGWQQGLDGYEITIQYSDDKKYSLKQYWAPLAQNGLKEAILVQQVYDKLADLSNAVLMQKVFERNIPFACYTTHNGSITCRVLSNAEKWDYKRRTDEYKRQLLNKKR